MGNVFRDIAIKTDAHNVTKFSDNDLPDPIRIQFPISTDSASIIRIPPDLNMSSSLDKRLTFRVRHAATDFPATVEAHNDHTMSILKRDLIEHMGMAFPSKNGKCKIVMVWNKSDLRCEEPLKDQSEINEQYLGGSVDHLRLGE